MKVEELSPVDAHARVPAVQPALVGDVAVVDDGRLTCDPAEVGERLVGELRVRDDDGVRLPRADDVAKEARVVLGPQEVRQREDIGRQPRVLRQPRVIAVERRDDRRLPGAATKLRDEVEVELVRPSDGSPRLDQEETPRRLPERVLRRQRLELDLARRDGGRRRCAGTRRATAPDSACGERPERRLATAASTRSSAHAGTHGPSGGHQARYSGIVSPQ